MNEFKLFDTHLHTYGSFLPPDLSLTAYLDQHQVDHAVILTTHRAANIKGIMTNDKVAQHPGSADFLEVLGRLRQTMAQGQLDHSDVIGIAETDPARFLKFFWFNAAVTMEEDTSLGILRDHFNKGFVGVKLHTGIQPASIPDGIIRLVEFMQSYDASFPLYIHSIPNLQFFTGIACDDIDKLASTFPELRIIVGHAAYAMEYAIELGLTVKRRENVFFETSCSIPYGVLLLMGIVGHERILFGSDAPITNPLQIEIDKILSLPVPDRVKAAIFYDNAERLFQPLMTRAAL